MKLELLQTRYYVSKRYRYDSVDDLINLDDLKDVCESSIEIDYLSKYNGYEGFKSHVHELISKGMLSTRCQAYELACNIKSSKDMELVEYRINIIFGFLFSAWYLTDEEYYDIFEEIMNASVCKICKDSGLPEFRGGRVIKYARVPLVYKHDLTNVISNEFTKRIDNIRKINLKKSINVGMDFDKATNRFCNALEHYKHTVALNTKECDSKMYNTTQSYDELSPSAEELLKIPASDLFKFSERYSHYFKKHIINEIITRLENVSAVKQAAILYLISKFQNIDYTVEIYDRYINYIIQKCVNLNNDKLVLEVYKDELRRLINGFCTRREYLWIGTRSEEEMEDEVKCIKRCFNTIRVHLRDKIDTLQRQRNTTTDEDIEKLHANVEMILDSCIENLHSITSAIVLNNIDISEKVVREIAEEVFPEKLQEYKDAMDNKVASRFARILNMTRGFGQMILEGKSDVEILVKYPSVIKDHKPALVKEAMDIIINEDRKMGIALKKWNKRHEKLFMPFSKQEFLQMKLVVHEHEFIEDEKEKAFQFIKENKLPYSLYMYKEVCKYLKDKEM